MNRSFKSFSRGGVLCIVGMLLQGGCATAAPSTRLDASAASIRAAEEVGAAKVPAAALHLQLAKEQQENAKRLIATRDGVKHDDAELLLMRAQADADLAVQIAREEVDRTSAQRAVDRAQTAQNTP